MKQSHLLLSPMCLFVGALILESYLGGLSSMCFAQESPPGCQDAAVSVAINPSPSGSLRHGQQVCYSVCFGAQGSLAPCDIANFDASLVLPDGSVHPVTANASIDANTFFCCPSADPRCLLTSPNNCYIVSHDDEITSFTDCPPVPSGDSGRVLAYTFGDGDSLTQQGDTIAPCATANNVVAHGSCCEPCSGTCTPTITCNECPGDSLFTLGGDCSVSCFLDCSTDDTCRNDGVCVPGSGRDNCATTPGGTPASCTPITSVCDVPPPGFTCDDANVCTADICVDDTDPGTPCCENTPILCPPLPCMRITGCDPVSGCQYTFDCREPGPDCCPDDGNPCTTESCDAATGLCLSAPDCITAADCNDQNVCTADSCVNSCCLNEDIPCPAIPCMRATGCDPVTGCIYVPDCRTGPLGTCCPDDGNVCTDEFCDQANGVCGATPDCVTAADCNDGDVCTADSCVNSCCVNTEIPCADRVCERNTDCDPVLGCLYDADCRNGPLATCCPDDGNICTHENCDAATGTCGQTVDCTTAADCNDLNLCTVDSCENSCCVHTPLVCPEIPCQRLVGCNPTTGCEYVDDCRTGPLGTCCPDDTNPCTQATCDPATGICGSQPDCVTDADCDDQSVCTTDTCENSCCVHTSILCPVQTCRENTGCDAITGCTYLDVTPCCGNGIVEVGETCDPPGSVLPDGSVCSDVCKRCGDGVLDDGEECEVGIACRGQAKPCKDIVCDPQQCRCIKVNKPNGSIVHWPEVDFCLDFLCQGGMAFDHPKVSGTPCGNATPEGVCDTPDSCDGFGTCASNYKDAGTICRPAVNECDIADRCSGLSGACAPDACVPGNGTLATDDGNECTFDVCDGHCQSVHPPRPFNTPCGNQDSSTCDFPDRCDGHGACDMNIVSTGNECRAARAATGAECMRGPNRPYPDPSCFTVDMDHDGDVDLTDCSLSMD